MKGLHNWPRRIGKTKARYLMIRDGIQKGTTHTVLGLEDPKPLITALAEDGVAATAEIFEHEKITGYTFKKAANE